MIGEAHPAAIAPAATHTAIAIGRGVPAVARRHPNTMTTGVGVIDRRLDAPWMTILAVVTTTLTGVTTHRRPIRMATVGRTIDHRRETSLPGIMDTPGMAGMDLGTMIGGVTGKSNHLLRRESLLNRRTRSRSPRAARILAAWQSRLVLSQQCLFRSSHHRRARPLSYFRGRLFGADEG